MTNVDAYIDSLKDIKCSREELEECIGKAKSRLQHWGFPRGIDYDRLRNAVYIAELRIKNW